MIEDAAAGFWKLPGYGDEPVSGVLHREDDGFRLMVAEREWPDGPAQHRSYPVLHGQLVNGQVISLLDCIDSSVSFGSGGHERQVSAFRALEGVHIESLEERCFTGLSAHYDHLKAWYSRTGLEDNYRGEGGGFDLSYRPLAPLQVDTQEFRVQLCCRAMPVVPVPDARTTTIVEAAWLELDTESPRELKFFLDIDSALRDLLSLSIGRPIECRPLYLKLDPDAVDANGRLPPVGFYASTIFKAAAEKPPHPYLDMLATYDHFEGSWQRLIERWLKNAELLRPVRALYMSAAFGRVDYLEQRYLALLQALETYHRRCRDRTVVSPETFEVLKESLISRLPKSEEPLLSRAIEMRLQYANEPSLAERLRDLVEEHSIALSHLIARPERLPGRLAQQRNRLTHLDPRTSSGPDSGARLHRLTEVARLLLELCLFTECGLAAEEVAALTSTRQAFLRRKPLFDDYC